MWILGLKGLTCRKHNKKDIRCRLSWFTMFQRNNLLSHKEGGNPHGERGREEQQMSW